MGEEFNTDEKNLYVCTYRCKNIVLTLDHLKEILKKTGSKITGKPSEHYYKPHGYSAEALLSEKRYNKTTNATLDKSAISIHTYPEENKVTCLTGMCGNSEPLEILRPLLRITQPESADAFYFTSAFSKGPLDMPRRHLEEQLVDYVVMFGRSDSKTHRFEFKRK